MAKSETASDLLIDSEFGQIKLIYNAGGFLRLNIRPNGEIVLSAPRRSSRSKLERFIDRSRVSLRTSLDKLGNKVTYHDGDLIGREHYLKIKLGVRAQSQIIGNQVVVTTVNDMTDYQLGQLLRQAVAKALRREAQHYLPKRLHYFAEKFNYRYDKVRLTYAKSRWGSCSSSGTISLNIALMQLPTELSDYVLLHELTHTVHMNHGDGFWRDMELHMPGARELNDRLRQYSPYL